MPQARRKYSEITQDTDPRREPRRRYRCAECRKNISKREYNKNCGLCKLCQDAFERFYGEPREDGECPF